MFGTSYFGGGYWGGSYWGGSSGAPVSALAPDGSGFKPRRIATTRPLEVDSARAGAAGNWRPGSANTRRGGHA